MLYRLSEIEQEILDMFWKKGRWMSGADVWNYFAEHGRMMKRQVVNTYLTRMADKGLLVKNGTKYIYAYAKEEFYERQAAEILDSMYEGSLKKFIVAATGNKKLSREEADELQKYLDSFNEDES